MGTPQEPPFVLIADDDPAQLARSRAAMRLAGAQVASCRTTNLALEALRFHMPNVVVVAPSMEQGKGWNLVYAARKSGALPTVVLDRENSEITRRTAFTAGVEDVVRLPCDETELAMRVIALATRSRRVQAGSPVHRHRGLVMDVAAHAVRVDGRAVALTAQQFAILRALLEANGATLGRERLLARIESLDDEPPSERAIDLHVTRLRRRLGDDARTPRWVEAVYGVGYRLASESEAAVGTMVDAEQVLSSLPDPLLVIDADRRVRFANDAAARFLARPRAELVGRQCADVLGCHDCDGRPLDGPRCLARSVAIGEAALRDVPAEIVVGDDRVPVRFTYARVHSDGLMTLEIRPRDDSAEGPAKVKG